MDSADKVAIDVKKFVDNFNKDVKYQSFPIVAFQFVSLNSVNNGKMVWWNYLHSSVKERYEKAIKEFTGLNQDSSQIKHTLINWEYDDNLYWYIPLGDGPVINSSPHQFLPVTNNIDKSGIERKPADPSEKKYLLETKWKDALINNVGICGSTMWVSLPHKEYSGNPIYSSVFGVFNGHLDKSQQIVIARLFRNFIIDFLIELYREPIQTKLEWLKMETLLDDYKPIKYNYVSDNRNKAVEILNKEFFTQAYLPLFSKVRDDALNRLINTYDKEEQKVKITGSYPKVYKPWFTLNDCPDKKKENLFFRSIYGRLLFLVYLLLFDKSITASYKLLTNANVTKAYIADIFGIDGLSKDEVDTGGADQNNSDIKKIVPFISKVEYRFLLSACERLKMNDYSNKSNRIYAARPDHLR